MKHVWKSRLLLGAAALALVAAAAPRPAQAQLFARSQPPAPLPLGPADQAIGGGFYMEADTMIRDPDKHTWVAKGSVEARNQGKVLRADEVDYDQGAGIVTAKGDVQLLNPDGTSEFAQSMTLDKDFVAGFALAFSTRQEPNVKIVADEAIRLNRDAMALNKAVFTVCDLCTAEGEPENPTWSMQAAQVIQDHEHKVIFYRHMVVRVRGVPVFYTPLFWHTDPSAKRGSGLLAPTIAIDGRRGFSYWQPYLWTVTPYADLVISPQFDTKVPGVLTGEYTERFYSGQVDARFGYTYAREFDSAGNPYGDQTSRSFILGSGAFVPAPNWTWGFSAERVTDPLMFQRYDIPNAFDPRGLFAADDQVLLSQLYTTEQTSKSYLSAAFLSWQSLRPGDSNGAYPVATPVIEGHYDPDYLILGGRLRLEGSGVVLQRSHDVTDTVTIGTNTVTETGPGVDSRRATIGGDWQSVYTLYDGIRLQPFLQARADYYNVDNITPTDTGVHNTERVLGTAGVDASWPFFRRQGDLTVVMEPIVQLAVSPKAVNNPYIPNEDSQVIEFDETNLFEANKSPGFDYYEGGARANVGEQVTFRTDGGAQAQVLVGRSLRAEPDPTLPPSSTLNQTLSDWVVAASATPLPGYSGFARALVANDGDVQRLEAGVNAGGARLNGFFRYLFDDIDDTSVYLPSSNTVVTTTKTENVQVGGQILFTKHWGISGSASLDIANRYAPLEQVGLVYQDECTHWELIYNHNGTYNGALHPSDTIMLRLLLVTLGSTGYQRPDFR